MRELENKDIPLWSNGVGTPELTQTAQVAGAAAAQVSGTAGTYVRTVAVVGRTAAVLFSEWAGSAALLNAKWAGTAAVLAGLLCWLKCCCCVCYH